MYSGYFCFGDNTVFNADNFRRWLAKVILPPDRWKESVEPTLTPEMTATESVTLKASFTPTAPKVRVLRVKKPKPKLGKQPNAQADRRRKGKAGKDPS